MRHIPPEGWPDFATKTDLAVVAERLNTVKQELRADFQSQTNKMIRWAITTAIAAVGAAAAVSGVLATVLA
jgi:hypothetical protein